MLPEHRLAGPPGKGASTIVRLPSISTDLVINAQRADIMIEISGRSPKLRKS